MASTELRAAAQQALEALEGYRRELGDQQPCDAEQALEAALAEPQEPDDPARRCGGPGCDGTCCQPVQEPVAYSVGRTLHWHDGKGVSDAQLFAAPPQRKPLTEEEIRDLLEAEFFGRDGKLRWDDDLQVFRLAERAHKIGGEG